MPTPEAVTTDTIIARWETRSKKWFVELTRHADGAYSYDAVGAGGCLGVLASDAVAIAKVESSVLEYRLPDANKTGFRRVL